MAIDLSNAPFELNLAEQLDEGTLGSIGIELKEQIEIDEDSRRTWMDNNKTWLRLASQVREDKSFPWPGASNVKFPLLTIASMQFNARALPNLVNSNQPVRLRVVGKDPDGQKLKRANRVAKYMSYQILEDMDDWMGEMDRLLFVLPMVGIAYKKTFFSEAKQRIRSVMVLPNDLIINYYAQSFERARMTQVLYMDENEIYELQAEGIFLDITLDEPTEDLDMNRNANDDILDLNRAQGSDMTPHEIYESHCWLDLDEDGYKEPYIVTLTKDGQVLRIAARWSEDNIYYKPNGDVAKILPDEYFTPYIFMPDPSSAVSGLGLGTLLGPVNESVNTLINQLIDAGTLSTLQGGFLGRGIKLRGGATRFRPGEWKIVNSTGDDIRKSVFPMPIRDPSSVLFQLLGMLIEYGERVSTVSDMMTGESPGQNQPASTTMAVLEQGLQVFTSINKRLHRQLTKEYAKIYRLDGLYLNEEHYNMVLDEALEDPNAMFSIEDFRHVDMDIKPASDPAMVSQTQKFMKAQALFELAQAGGPINIEVATRKMLEAQGQEDIEEIMAITPRPNPEFQLEQQKFQHQQLIDAAEIEIEALKVRNQAIKDETGAELNLAKIQEIGAKISDNRVKTEADIAHNEAKLIIEAVKANAGGGQKSEAQK